MTAAEGSTSPIPQPLHIYLTTQHPNRHVRVFAMSCIYQLMCLRSLALFKREILMVLGCLMLISYYFGCSLLLLLGMLFACVHLWCWWQAGQRLEYFRGHRAGAHGYTGDFCENTIEVMRALVQQDNSSDGPVQDLHYIEVDIQETADGDLVVFHDFQLARAFPDTGPNTEAYQQLHQQGVSWPGTAAHVKDLTIAQLRSLHIAGRQGLHAPTLAEFIAAFQTCNCRRPLVIEVKRLQTDKGRMKLLELLRQHKPYAEKLEKEYPEFRNPYLRFLAVIAFPHYYTACFGEFGSKQCKHWTRQFEALGIPVRCCYLEALSYRHGLNRRGLW